MLVEPSRMRLDSVDAWRGLIIVVMMLDHARDFFYYYGLTTTSPTDPAHTTAALYVTRWITHLCAPTFVFLAGVSIRLQREKAAAVESLPRFLLTRGLWIAFVGLTLASFGINMGRPFFFFEVLYAIGISMALMAALVRLPTRAVMALGVAVVMTAPLMILPLLHATGGWAALRTLTVLPGPLPALPGLVLYPFVPWLGVLCVGYGYGHVFRLPRRARERTVLGTAVGLLVAFLLLRGLNGYGDPAPWRLWPDLLRDMESFLNVTKYPASPDFVMVTLGLSLLLFLLLDRVQGRIVQWLLPFGRTPLFCYVTHIYVVHLLQIGIGLSLGFPLSKFLNTLAPKAGAAVTGRVWGFPLAGAYLAWVILVLLMYPLARWFASVKQRRRDWWLRYL